MKKFGIVVHGGAGTIRREKMTGEQEAIYKKGMREALENGYEVLMKGGTSLDAVEAAVKAMEDYPYFNAGRGAVFNHEGKHEMDASIMTGHDLKAGAICAVVNVKNPITLAKEVMTSSEHVFLCGRGAEEFARERHLEFADNDYFFSEERFEQLQGAKSKNVLKLDHGSEKKFGTVGAVALDQEGNLSAATSTGGITNKRFGRVGDSAIIGAGTYANNKTCAVSCTGHGEYFIRAVAANRLSALIELKQLDLKDAADLLVHEELIRLGGEGGLIAIDQSCNIEMPFNSEGMYRGYLRNNEEIFLGIY